MPLPVPAAPHPQPPIVLGAAGQPCWAPVWLSTQLQQLSTLTLPKLLLLLLLLLLPGYCCAGGWPKVGLGHVHQGHLSPQRGSRGVTPVGRAWPGAAELRPAGNPQGAVLLLLLVQLQWWLLWGWRVRIGLLLLLLLLVRVLLLQV